MRIATITLVGLALACQARGDGLVAFGSSDESGEAGGTETGGDVDPGVDDMPAPPDIATEPDGDGRLHLAEINEALDGRWEKTDAWSPVMPWSTVALADHVPVETAWPCEPDPDVDACVRVDSVGHVACMRHEVEFGVGVSVAPVCAVRGDHWIDVGNGMVAFAD